MIAHLLTSAKACILSQWVPKGIVLWIVNAASQWQATLQCNVFSHWLSTFTIWSLFLIWSIFHLYHHCTVMESPFYPRGPIYKHGLTSIPAWICNSIHYKEWDEITYPFLYFNIFTVEVCEWMLNFIPHFKGRFRGGRTGYMPPLSKIISNTIIFITILYRDRYTILQWKIIFQIYHNWDIYKLKYMYTINIIIIFFEIYKNNSTTPDHHLLHHPHPTPTPPPPHPHPTPPTHPKLQILDPPITSLGIRLLIHTEIEVHPCWYNGPHILKNFEWILIKYRSDTFVSVDVLLCNWCRPKGMLTSSNGNIFRITGNLCREFTRALMFSLICTWTNVWINNGEAGDLRHHCAHHVMGLWNLGCYTRLYHHETWFVELVPHSDLLVLSLMTKDKAAICLTY